MTKRKKIIVILVLLSIALSAYLILTNFTIKDGQIKRYYGDARDNMSLKEIEWYQKEDDAWKR